MGISLEDVLERLGLVNEDTIQYFLTCFSATDQERKTVDAAFTDLEESLKSIMAVRTKG